MSTATTLGRRSRLWRILALLLAFAIVAPLHIYKQLRGTYAVSRFSATWRLVMLTGFILVILALFLQALLVLGAF